jgi:hypothetical protein
MAIVLTQEGGKLLWQYMLGIKPWTFMTLHLIGDSFTVAHTSTQALLAPHELVTVGYGAAQIIPGTANWTFTPITQGQQATYIPLSWTFAGACVVYGYWLSDSTQTISIFGENFAAPFVYNANGGQFVLNLPPTLISVP